MADDGEPYTLKEFRDYYGDEAQELWDAADEDLAVKDLDDMVLHDGIDDDDPDNPDSSPWKHWSFKMGMRMVMFKLPNELTYASRVSVGRGLVAS